MTPPWTPTSIKSSFCLENDKAVSKDTAPGVQLRVLASVRGIILPGVCMGVCNGGGFPSIHMEIEALELGFGSRVHCKPQGCGPGIDNGLCLIGQCCLVHVEGRVLTFEVVLKTVASSRWVKPPFF